MSISEGLVQNQRVQNTIGRSAVLVSSELKTVPHRWQRWAFFRSVQIFPQKPRFKRALLQ